MDITYTLTRGDANSYGVFGTMITDKGDAYATLEHAYVQADGSYVPKVAPGTYTCLRHPPNRLPYEAFELQNVPDFMGKPVDGILVHSGNYNADSIGCILLGMSTEPTMITQSGIAFRQFMDNLEGQSSFTLVVQ